MKLFIISLLYAINLPSLSLGFKCYTCSESGSGIGHCAENQEPVLKECQVESPSVPHCYLEEYLLNRKPFKMGCYGVLPTTDKSSNCHTTTSSTLQGGDPINLFVCSCGTDSCNTYENRTQCLSCVGNIGHSGGSHSRTDYKCKDGEKPFNETKFPLNEQFGCIIKWDEGYRTEMGCSSSERLDSAVCYGSKDYGQCTCSTNFCNTEDLKEEHVKSNPEPDTSNRDENRNSGLIIMLIFGIGVPVIIVCACVFGCLCDHYYRFRRN